MKQLYSDIKKILFVAALAMAALGWLNAAHATRSLDRIMTQESGTAAATANAPDTIGQLIDAAPREYHSTVRVLPHPVQGMTAAEAQAVYEARRQVRQCDWLELGCFIDREVGL